MVKRVPGPDGLEKGLRIACGAILGLILFGPFALRLAVADSSAWVWAALAIGVALFAILALRYGDRFWERFSAWWAAWWPWWP